MELVCDHDAHNGKETLTTTGDRDLIFLYVSVLHVLSGNLDNEPSAYVSDQTLVQL